MKRGSEKSDKRFAMSAWALFSKFNLISQLFSAVCTVKLFQDEGWLLWSTGYVLQITCLYGQGCAGSWSGAKSYLVHQSDCIVSHGIKIRLTPLMPLASV